MRRSDAVIFPAIVVGAYLIRWVLVVILGYMGGARGAVMAGGAVAVVPPLLVLALLFWGRSPFQGGGAHSPESPSRNNGNSREGLP